MGGAVFTALLFTSIVGNILGTVFGQDVREAASNLPVSEDFALKVFTYHGQSAESSIPEVVHVTAKSKRLSNGQYLVRTVSYGERITLPGKRPILRRPDAKILPKTTRLLHPRGFEPALHIAAALCHFSCLCLASAEAAM